MDNMNKTLGIVIVAVLIVGGFLYWRGQKIEVTPIVQPNIPKEVSEVSISTADTIKTFTVVGKQFSFSLAEIKVKKWDTVRIVFQNQEGTHDWVIDEFSARTAKIEGGQSQTIEFVADKTGSFEYYCSVGQHKQLGMKGKLIVE